MTRLAKRLGILAPFRFIEISGEKMAGVVSQQWIDADGAFASEMLVDDRIRQRNQQTVIAFPAFDTRLFANTRQPLIATGRCVARLTGGFAFPTDWVNVGATAK
ncbi:MAG: hypothetical protein Q8L56_14185 [Rhodocyclaceae bacterium]|nr:hypothetical protein [Rhodocyclaceae bacterium]